MKNRLLLCINPVSGKGKAKAKLFDTVKAFSDRNYSVTVLLTRPGRGTEKDILEGIKNFDTVVAVGGDGTLNNVINGIMKSKAQIPLGYIPFGSTNDFAASFGLTDNIDKEVERIAGHEPSPIDVGSFNDDYFAYIACTGVFTESSYSTSRQMKNALGQSAYIFGALSNLSVAHDAEIKIETQNEIIEGSYIFASVINSLRAGGIFKFTQKDVSFDDGLFELLLAPSPDNFTEGSALVRDVISSGLSSRKLIHRKVDKCIISCKKPQKWSVDGENGGENSRVTINVHKKALFFIK